MDAIFNSEHKHRLDDLMLAEMVWNSDWDAYFWTTNLGKYHVPIDNIGEEK